jgi:acyl transferase domain-containing protein
MQEAVPAGVGAMAAILGLDAAAVGAVCREAGGAQVVEPVNFNGPEQTVIAGHKEAVERAIAIATERGAKRGLLLPVSAPFHSSLMKPAANRLAARLAGVNFNAPRFPFCTTSMWRKRAPPTRSDRAGAAGREPGALGRNHQAFAARGVTHVIECGPGRVLTGLNKRIVRELKSFALTDGADLDAAKAAVAADDKAGAKMTDTRLEGQVALVTGATVASAARSRTSSRAPVRPWSAQRRRTPAPRRSLKILPPRAIPDPASGWMSPTARRSRPRLRTSNRGSAPSQYS